jgi:hypothetical protein
VHGFTTSTLKIKKLDLKRELQMSMLKRILLQGNAE